MNNLVYPLKEICRPTEIQNSFESHELTITQVQEIDNILIPYFNCKNIIWISASDNSLPYCNFTYFYFDNNTKLKYDYSNDTIYIKRISFLKATDKISILYWTSSNKTIHYENDINFKYHEIVNLQLIYNNKTKHDTQH